MFKASQNSTLIVYGSGKLFSNKIFLTYIVPQDRRKHLRIKGFYLWMEYSSVVSLAIPATMGLQASGIPHHAQVGVSSHAWAASLFNFSCPQPPLLQPWTGNSRVWVWLFIHHHTALASPRSPAYPSLKVPSPCRWNLFLPGPWSLPFPLPHSPDTLSVVWGCWVPMAGPPGQIIRCWGQPPRPQNSAQQHGAGLSHHL